MKPPIVRLIWKCVSCGDVVVSYSQPKRNIEYCNCGKSGVDLDEHSYGISGKIEEISRKELVMGTGWVTITLKPLMTEIDPNIITPIAITIIVAFSCFVKWRMYKRDKLK